MMSDDYPNYLERLVSEREICVEDDGPYLRQVLVRTVERLRYNPNYKYANEICMCGHSYERHFDGFEGNAPVGCKYCGCGAFEPDLQQLLFPELPDNR